MTALDAPSGPRSHDAEAFPSFRLSAEDALRALVSPVGAKRWLGTDIAGPRLQPGCVFTLADGRTGTVRGIEGDLIALGVKELDGTESAVELTFRATSERRSTIDVSPPNAGLDALLAGAEDVVWDAVDRRTPRQAVVLIHGIGEQTPGSTVREFAEAVVPSVRRLLSKPDRFAPHFELRRLQAFADEKAKRPRTDFFEYYWAHKLGETPKRQVVGWVLGLARRPRDETPPQLHTLWWLVRALPVFALVAVAALVWVFGFDEVRGVWSRIVSLAPVAFVISAVAGAITAFVTTSLGDAARYLTAHPSNVEVRTAIRDGGIDLLRELQASGRYHRIVVVGHSLGSVIAYDMLTHLWAEQHVELDLRRGASQPALDAYERAKDGARGATPKEHHGLQHELWKELRRDGSPWLVTDLVTLGSPLTHALLLMANDRKDLDRRKRSREFPTCPPQPDERSDGIVSPNPFSFPPVDLPGRPRVLHHGAPFGPCRWTNLYFPAAGGLFGDPVGGPLTGVFGEGILDVAVTRTSKSRSPASHSFYWRPDPKAPAEPGDPVAAVHSGETLDALTALRAVLDLASRDELRTLAATLPIDRFVVPAAAEAF